MLGTTRRATTVVAALGTLLALVLVGLTPTSASAAPKCRPGYPASVATVTKLSVPRLVRARQNIRAKVTVISGAGRPSGRVALSVGGRSYGLTLHGGTASKSLGRLGAGRTYRITASYGGSGCWKPSSAAGSITVKRVGRDSQAHFSRLSARSVHRGGHPRVSGHIVKASGRGATGRVRVQLSSHGHVRYAKTVRLHHGRFSATFPRVRQVGVWTASARGGGVSASTTFRVRR
jgi:hypothetical protein